MVENTSLRDMMNSNFHTIVRQIKVDSAIGNKLLKETDNFFDVTAKIMKRMDELNPSRVQQVRRASLKLKPIVRTTSIY